MPLATTPLCFAPYGFESTHHGGGARGISHYEDLRPTNLDDFHKLAFAAGYEVRRRHTADLGYHYAALDELKVMGIYPHLEYIGRGRPPKSFTPMLLVRVES